MADVLAAGSTARSSSLPGEVSAHQGDFGVLAAAAAQVANPMLAIAVGATGAMQIVWANDAVLDLFQVEAVDLLGHEVRTVTASRSALPEWSDVVLGSLVEPAGSTSSRLATLTRPDGSSVVVQVRLTPAGEAGWVVRLDPLTSAEQRADEARRESEHRFQSLAEHAPVGIVVSDRGVRLGFVNARFVELAGLPASQLAGSRWLDVIHPEDLPGLLDALQSALSGRHVEKTVRIMTVGDTPKWAQFRLAPVTTPRRAAGFIGTVEDITVRRAWEAQLTYQASHDPLTGLANRRALLDTLSDLLAGSRDVDRQFALLFCDLNGFKRINDTLGHHAGDLVLVEVGRRLCVLAREHDLVSRIAGDEFVVLLQRIRDRSEAEAAAARYLSGLVTPVRVGGVDLPISASIGVALPDEADTPESLLRAADYAMYEAKNATRSRALHATPGSES